MVGGGGISMAITSVTSWLTPTVLFIVLNLMIAIIFVASNFKPPHHQNHHQQYHHQDSPSQLARSPSLLERVKSINFSSFYPSESHEITTEYNSVSQLTGPPSFLQRVRSIDLSFSSYYYTPPPVDQVTELADSPSQLTRVPSFMERVKSFKLASPFTSDQQSGDNFYTPPPVDQIQPSDSDQTRRDSVSQLTRVPSFLERVKSFRLTTSPFSSDPRSNMDRDPHRDPTQDDDVASEESETFSDDVAPATEKASPATTVMTKSRSERRMPESDDDGESDGEVDRRRPATMRASIGGKEECVDAKADDFIKRFKQQLKLQRLDSLQRFREMLNRGASA